MMTDVGGIGHHRREGLRRRVQNKVADFNMPQVGLTQTGLRRLYKNRRVHFTAIQSKIHLMGSRVWPGGAEEHAIAQRGIKEPFRACRVETGRPQNAPMAGWDRSGP